MPTVPASGAPGSPHRLVETGIPALDSDQRCLFRSLDLLRGVETNAEAEAMILPVLEVTSTYSAFHFSREERVMRAVDYPHAALHAREHALFLRWLDTLKDSGATRADPETAERLYHEILDWFRHHFLLMDVPVRPFLGDVERLDQIARDGAAACLVATERPPRRPRRPDLGPYAESALMT